jgi:hypothetical protein
MFVPGDEKAKEARQDSENNGYEMMIGISDVPFRQETALVRFADKARDRNAISERVA